MVDIDLIIVANGKSIRFGSNKLDSLLLNNQTVLETTINQFHKTKLFRKIIVIRDNYKYLSNKQVVVMNGGQTRQRSVLKGLSYVTSQYVAIHDGARPFIPISLIKKMVNKISDYDSIAVAKQTINTVRLINNDNIIEKCIKKNNIALIETPQIFNTNKILKAHNNNIKLNINDDEDDIETYLRLFKKDEILIIFHSFDNKKITFRKGISTISK